MATVTLNEFRRTSDFDTHETMDTKIDDCDSDHISFDNESQSDDRKRYRTISKPNNYEDDDEDVEDDGESHTGSSSFILISQSSRAQTSSKNSKKKISYHRQQYEFEKEGFREKISQQLGKKFNSIKNGQILEKYIPHTCAHLCKIRGLPVKQSSLEFKFLYTSIAYEILTSPEKNIQKIVEKLKKHEVQWKSPEFKDLIDSRATEEADHTQDITEGIHECNDCKKNGRVYNKTQNIQIQTRSGDEGMTVFITCCTCRKMWKQFN